MVKVASIVGARPQFIKLKPVANALENAKIEHVIIHTGQHYDYEMSKVFFQELSLPEPKYNLGVGSALHGKQTGQMLEKIEKVLLEEKPDIVLVYGDTNSTLAGALAAVKLHIPVAHVEAGLRSYNKRMPEEINRVLTDHVSDLLFCPTHTAVENLKKEGIEKGVFFVGDVMYDAVLEYGKIAQRKSQILGRLALDTKSYALATVHRAENTDNLKRLENIFLGLSKLAQNGLKVIVPLHPRTRKVLSTLSISESLPSNLLIIEPVSYLDMLMLEKNARVILTDSGGVQKEAFFFRVPCVTLREETEWVETVETGWNALVGTDPDRILDTTLKAKPGTDSASSYGDGRAGERVFSILESQVSKYGF
ncbi:UDP-N-acetylglucosamine 2-epimerase (non-hydrolyzing) [Thermodesulfovibrio hydrogeniphilus]